MRRQEVAYLRGLAALVAGIILVVDAHAPAAAQSAGLDGAVFRGSCDRLADQVSDLTPAVFGTGEHRGNNQAMPATSFFATIPIPLDDLLADDHVVAASDPEAGSLVCGVIGGVRTDDGGLLIGLRSEKESSITGVAYIAPGDEASQTDVSVLIAGDLLAEISNARTQEEAAYADDMIRISQSIVESFSSFAALIENPQLGVNDWSNDIKAQVAIWDSNYDEALGLNPPPVFAETHALLIEALRLYSEAGDDFVAALDTRDSELAYQAVSTVAEADELFRQVMEVVDRVREDRGE
jgi:hypothetical protein